MRHEHGGRTDAVPHPAQQLLSYTHRFSARGRRARCRCGGTLARALWTAAWHQDENGWKTSQPFSTFTFKYENTIESGKTGHEKGTRTYKISGMSKTN